MAANEIHVGDVGTVFERTVTEGGTAVDVSAATVKQMIFRKPDGSLLTKTASFGTDGTDGVLTYTTVDGDLDQPGQWQLQVRIVSAAWSGRSDVAVFDVHRNLS